VPPFAIGRPGYDNWLLWAAATRGAKVIDATAAVTVVHQRHDYSHVGGKSVAYRGAEAEQNKQLIGDWRHLHSILHCPWVLTASLDVAPARDLQHRTARLRSRVSHLVRFTRPLRQQLHERRALRSLQKTGRSET
jgi:hypothetical protein